MCVHVQYVCVHNIDHIHIPNKLLIRMLLLILISTSFNGKGCPSAQSFPLGGERFPLNPHLVRLANADTTYQEQKTCGRVLLLTRLYTYKINWQGLSTETIGG